MLCRRPASMRGNLEGLNDEGQVVENYKVAKRLIGHQSGTIKFYFYKLLIIRYCQC